MKITFCGNFNLTQKIYVLMMANESMSKTVLMPMVDWEKAELLNGKLGVPALQSRIHEWAKDSGWERVEGNRFCYQKDGYEVYFFQGGSGLELTVRDEKTMTRSQVLSITKDEICITSPLYIAFIEHILQNAETISAKHAEQ